MDNDAYAQSFNLQFPYIIIVKKFSSAILCVPTQDTVAYSHPDTRSNIVYTFSAPVVSTDRYPITELVFCSYDYWVKFPYLGDDLKTGYVKCSDLGFDYEKYVDPSEQTPNPQIGSNKDVIFNMWYFPNGKYKGVNYAVPLYYQYYLENGNPNTNSKKCTLLSSISGLYKYKGTDYDPTVYLNEMTARYWTDKDGLTLWLAAMKTTATQDDIRRIAKRNLNNQNPILVGAGKGAIDHMVLVVGYKNCGNSLSDYIVLDSIQKNFSTLKDFFDRFPNFPTTWKYLTGGYVYGEY